MGKLRMENGNFYNEDYMTFEECLDVIKSLSRSQGFYGRLLRDINELDVNSLEELRKEWENKQFKSDLDFILYLEC